MVRRVVPWLAAVALAGCGFDLELPPPDTLTVDDAFPSVAPREAHTLLADGGARPYAFAFSGGLAASGPDATIDPATGDYVAGSLGPAIDVVEVRDASGHAVEVRIQVGPPLDVSPRAAFVAPGGQASFVATGGKPPYQLELVSGADHGTVLGTDFNALSAGDCRAAVPSPGAVALRLRDATSATPIDLAVTVGRGLDLFPAAGDGRVAPWEEVAFIASGGQPPYGFSMAPGPVPSGGPGIDPGRGTYAAGATGDVVDVVRVADANGELRCFDVRVGPGLSFELTTSDARPGQPARVVATGGRPPYAFSFTEKGNRSRGTLDPVTGVYVPGYNAGATDLVTVRDSTEAPPLPAKAVLVGPLASELVGGADRGCAMADADGDAIDDLFLFGDGVTVVSHRPGQAPRIVTAAGIGGADTMVGTSPPAIGDLDGDARADLAWVTDSGALAVAFGQPDGRLVAGGIDATITPSALAIAPGSPVLFGYGSTPSCSGLFTAQWNPATRAFVVGTPCPPATPGLAWALASADFDGDLLPDVAYGKTAASYLQKVYFRLAREAFATEHELSLPATWRLERYLFIPRQTIAVHPHGAPFSDLAAIVYDGPRSLPTTRTGIALFRGGPAGLEAPQVDPVDFDGLYNVQGLSSLGMEAGGRPRLAVSNGADGQVRAYDYPAAPGPLALSEAQPPPRAYRVAGACGGDVDADGIEDLAVAPRDPGPRAEILLGEFDGGWNQRPRFQSSSTALTSDVDGDGRPDLLGRSPSQGLEVLFVDRGQLAVGPETSLDGPLNMAHAGDWDGDGTADVVARIGASGFSFLRGTGGGAFTPPAPIAVTLPDGKTAYDAIAINFARARLGGQSPGPDVLTYGRTGSRVYFSSLRFSDATHATFEQSPILYTSEYAGIADLDGDGLDDLVITEASGYSVLLARPAPTGLGWPFAAPVTVGAPSPDPLEWSTIAGRIDVPGSDPPRQRVVIARRKEITLIEAPSGIPAAASVPLTVPIDSGYSAAVGEVTGDGHPDLVIGRQDSSVYPPVSLGWEIVRGAAGGTFEPGSDPTLALPPIADIPPFLLVPSEAGPADLILFPAKGAFFLHNDGAGHLQ